MEFWNGQASVFEGVGLKGAGRDQGRMWSPLNPRERAGLSQPRISAPCLVTRHFRAWTGGGMKEPVNRACGADDVPEAALPDSALHSQPLKHGARGWAASQLP